MSITSTAHFQDTFRAAIALNNHGVALLEKHCYEQAMCTLRDAVATVQSLFSTTGVNPETLAAITREASIRLANPHSSRVSLIHVSVLAGDYNQHGNYCNDCLPLFAAGCSPSAPSAQNTIVFPMRSDDTNSNFSCESIDINVALMFYNYALAHWCCSYIVAANATCCFVFIGSGQKPLTYKQAAVQLLEIAQNLLEVVYARCGDEYLLRTTASINATVSACIVRFLVSDPDSSPSIGNPVSICCHYLQRVVELESLTGTLDGIFYYWKAANDVAAAA